MKINKQEEREFNIASELFTGLSGNDTAVGVNRPVQMAAAMDPEVSGVSKKFETIYDWAKKLLLFMPGAWFLYMTTLNFVLSYPRVGLSPVFIFWFISGSLIVWLGLGDMRKIRHALIPVSVIILSTIIGILFSFLFSAGNIDIDLFFRYSMYFFPLVLVVPVVVKSILDEGAARSEV